MSLPCHMCACAKLLQSCLTLCATLWTATHQAPLLMGFTRQEYGSGLPCPPPGDLPDPRIKLTSLLHLQADSLPLVPPGKPCKQSNASYFIKVPLTTIWCEPNLETGGSIWRRPNVEKEMATHSSILAWRIPWTEKPGRLQSMVLQRVRHDWANSFSVSNVAEGRLRRCEVHFRDKIHRTLASWICLKGKKTKELSVHFSQGRQWCC